MPRPGDATGYDDENLRSQAPPTVQHNKTEQLKTIVKVNTKRKIVNL